MDIYEEIMKGHYGSFELRKYLARYLWIGLTVSVCIHVSAFGSYFAAMALTRKPPPPSSVRFIDITKVMPRPIIVDNEARIFKIAERKAPLPQTGKPVPVPIEEIAEDDRAFWGV